MKRKGQISFSRDSSGDPFEPTTIKIILDDTLSLCEQKILYKNVKLVVSGNLETSLMCRSSQISQVIMNLIGNSLDAIETLPEKWIKISVTSSAQNIEVLFMDSGPGIPDFIVDRMMQPFYTTKEVGKGTGLGLSISLGIMASHGGELTYVKNKGNTCFSLNFKVS